MSPALLSATSPPMVTYACSVFPKAACLRFSMKCIPRSPCESKRPPANGLTASSRAFPCICSPAGRIRRRPRTSKISTWISAQVLRPRYAEQAWIFSIPSSSIGDRYGAAALVELLGEVEPAKIKGTLTVAFVVQQRTGARGLQRILTQTQADEMIYVGRLLPGGPIPEMETMHRAPRRELGGGVLVGVPQTDGSLPAFATELKQLADANNISFASDYSASILPRSYLPLPALPAKWAHLAIATSWTDTPA